MATENVTALLSERRVKLDSATQMSDRAEAENRDLTPGEEDTIKTLVKDARVIAHRIEAARGQISTENSWDGKIQPQLTKMPRLDGGWPEPSSPIGRGGLFGGDGGSVANALFGEKRDTGGFHSFGDWLQTLDSGRFDSRMVASNTIGIDSEGGFLVPSYYQQMYLDAVIEGSIIASRCFKVPMLSNELKISSWDGNDHSTNLFGGFIAAWESEVPSLSEQTPNTRQITLTAKKLMILGRGSNELISDAAMYERMLGSALVKATSWQLDYELLRGNGSAKPLGCINADSRVTVAKESSQVAATVWYTNILKMFSRLHPASYATAIWVCNPTVLPELFTLDVHESSAALGSALVGDSTYMPFKESNGAFTLFGRPVLVTEKLPVLGQEGDLALIDPEQYILGVRQEVIIEKTTHAGFLSDSSYYRSKLRVGGQPMWAAPMTPRHGDDLSWCVTLAVRE